MQPVYRHFPEVKAKHHVLLDFNNLTLPKGFEARMPKNDTISPSSGWLGWTLLTAPFACHMFAVQPNKSDPWRSTRKILSQERPHFSDKRRGRPVGD